MNFKTIKLGDIVLFNPKESIKKGILTKKVSMDMLKPFCRDIQNFEIVEFTGGTKFRNGDTLMARITPCLENGKTVKVNILQDNEVGFGSTEYIVFRAIEGVTDADFLYYLVCSPIIHNTAIKSMVGSSGRQRVQTDVLKNLEISIPDLETQRKIGSLLKSLDDKIELNNRINKNLEEQAQAIFKSWFVDFEPFGCVMPDNWIIGTFSDIIISTLGGDWGKETRTGNYTEQVYCIRGADITEVRAGNKGKMPTRYILPKNFQSKQLTANDIVIEISGGSPTQSTGRVCLISQALLNRYNNSMICTNFCRAIKPLKNYSTFIYYYIQYLYNKKIFFLYENGTTGIKNLNLSDFIETEKIVIPSEEDLIKFNKLCHSFFGKIFKNSLENENLSALRDALLPKLMNGQIDVSEI
ncbi:MAG: restriction endonuclease subunit S [Ruminococcus sp.]|nr:restriction endonuclease subunit S [Ruminococcus sp.]